ncbi:MAG: sulfotransferase [Chloroflexota bacterium]|nr:sulfotransferase [Chloroflexota bacterium]
MNKGPIFIAGLERSGTSLIYALLASHANIAMTRRTNLWTHFYNQYGDISDPANFERCLSMMMRYKRLLVLEPDPEALRQEYWQGETTYARLFALLEEQYARRMGKPRWGDKSLNTERYADPIFDAYPNARMIHMMRDPRDRYASVITRWKVRRGGVGAGTAMWLESVKLARRNQQRYPDRYMILRYETLALQPEETLQTICDFIGEPYSPDMLTMEGAPTFLDKGGNSSYGSRKPGVISPDSIGRYRRVLSKGEIAFVQSRATPEMLAFDYQPDPVTFEAKERMRYMLAQWPLNAARMVAWRAMEAAQDRMGRPVPSYRLVPEAGAA